ncbi:MAG TPA: hypothetical protein VNH11_24090 [Pirellulales bacterium]|nr:hypothetical protein [Pirellulales bacterium]
MLLRISLLAALVSFALGAGPNEASAAGRLAAFRAARAAAQDAAAAATLPPPAAMPYTAQPVSLQPAAPVEPMVPAAGPVAGCGMCCPQPCLIYRHRGHHRVCCGCAPPVETVLTATNPCTCCPVAIPVCLPGCCNCPPTVSCHSGLFCAGVVEYDWSCGYRVTVRFKHNGEVVVVSRG